MGLEIGLGFRAYFFLWFGNSGVLPLFVFIMILNINQSGYSFDISQYLNSHEISPFGKHWILKSVNLAIFN